MLTEQLQLLKDLLEGDPRFNVCTVIGADPKTIPTTIAEQIARLKLSAEFQMIGAGASTDGSPWAQFDEIYPAVWFYDNRTLNKSDVTSLILAEWFCELVKAQGGWLIPDEQALDLAPGVCLTFQPDNDYVIHGVVMKTCGVIGRTMRQVATPVITETAGNITLTCATAPAAIYYTLDGSPPNAGNPEAVHYTGLFAPDADLELRVAAFAFGWAGSEEATLESTAGGGSGISNEFVNVPQFIAAWNALSGNLKFSANGDLILQTREETVGDRTLHQVHATKVAVGQPVSVVADDAVATLP